jgi:glycosyltransferase involved in cell wall biosynthesis
MDSIPDDVRVITGSPTLRVSELSAVKARGMGFRFMLLRAILAAWTKLFGKGLPAWILTAINGAIDGQYDLAVSFSQPIGDFELCALSNEVVLRCANARKKATFLHCDFSEYGGDSKRNRKLLSKFDWIAAVSDGVRDKFRSVCPELAEKTRTVLNCINCEEVIELSLHDPVCYTEAISLVTVARLAPEKGLLRCIRIIKKLRDSGMDICWHIVGGGPCEAELMELILRDNASSCVQMHGQQLNPYRYMKNADFLFVPSFHEAAPIVFNEARCLGLPIITTDTLSAQELVVSRGGGVSCINTAEGIETF